MNIAGDCRMNVPEFPSYDGRLACPETQHLNHPCTASISHLKSISLTIKPHCLSVMYSEGKLSICYLPGAEQP